MRAWGLGAVVMLAVLAAACGGNSTKVGITITGPGTSPLTVLVSSSVQFSAAVTGVSATTVYWQVCKETVSPPSTITPPTDCTAGQGVPQCTIPKVSSPLTGYGVITEDGIYTAPAAVPQPDNVLILATSCVDSTAFTTFTVVIDSGIRVTVLPSSATIGTEESFQFTATVTPMTNPGVSWQVCQSATGTAGLSNCASDGSNGLGSISPSGLYQAPPTPVAAIVQATSSADQSKSGTATVSVVTAVSPTLSSIDPTMAAEGSVQQDVYLRGTNFLSTSSVTAGGVQLPSTNVVFLGSTLMRVTIPTAQLAQAGTVPLAVQAQNGNSSGAVDLTVSTVRPGLVSSSPDSLTQNSAASPNVILTGGFFSAATTTATFNGQPVPATVNSSRQLFLSIPAGSLATPGLYPVAVANSGVAAEAALNVAVTPAAISGAASAPIGVGSGPSAVAIDEADEIAVIANTNDDTVTLVNLATDTLVPGGPIAVGSQPTGVAVDDLLPDHLAFVVNSGDNSVSVIDLSIATPAVTATLELGPYAPSIIPTGTVPFSIAVNPLTHRALIANQSTNLATVLDLSNANPSLTPPCNAPPCPVSTVGGGNTLFSTGTSPAVAVDPRLNWAVVTPGGAGVVSLVDLGVDANAVTGQLARSPQVIGSISISTTLQGVGINPETHLALLADPATGKVTTFSLLDGTVTTVTNQGVTLSMVGAGAAAADQLENVGIAVSGTTETAVVVDMETGIVLQTVTGLGASSPASQSVAVDPASNQAVVVNQSNGTISILSLGPALDPLQIVEASPAVVFGPAATNVPITITGSGFLGGLTGSEVTLDGTPISVTSVSANGRQLVATVAEALLSAPRHYTVQVENPSGGAVSNVTDLTVAQAVPVGNAPVGVAVDTDRDLAVVSNSGDGTATLIALTPNTPVGMSQTPAGMIEPIATITAGTTPEGVATIPRLGLAVVTNNGSDNATVIDVTQTNVPFDIALCATTSAECNAPAGVAIDQDEATVVVANTNPSTVPIAGTVSLFSLPATTSTVGTPVTVDQDPVAVAIDPNPELSYAAVGTASSSSSVDFVDLPSETDVGRVLNLANPSGIVFDPVNQVFLVANSLMNEIAIIDPATFTATTAAVGIGPTSIDYNFQTSTIVTANAASNTMSVMAYTCPPSGTSPATTCFSPQVRTVLALGGTQTSVHPLGANAVAVDPKLNLAVLVDEDNNRVLLVPLPY